MISIIIPVFNASKYLQQCFESCAVQTFNDIEIIAIDDASTDNSLEIIEQWAKKDFRVKNIRHNTNLGLVQSRKTGIENATGEYVCFLDSDDTLFPDAIESLLKKAKGKDVVIGQLSVCTESDHVLRVTHNTLPFGDDSHGIFCAYISKKTVGSLCGRLIRLEKLKTLPSIPTDITIGEDFIANLLLTDISHSVCLLDKPVYNYYQHPTSMSNTNNRNKANQRMKFIEWVVSFVQTKPKSDDLNNCLALFCIEEYFSFLRDGGDVSRNPEINYLINNVFLSNNYALSQTPSWRKLMLRCYKLSPNLLGPIYRFCLVGVRNLFKKI